MTLLHDLTDRYVNVDGRRIRYLEAGKGQPLVLVHGLAVQNSADQWLTNFDELTKVAHIYALDMPGWGLSDLPEQYTFPTWVNALLGFFDALGLAQADLLGQSLGGWISGLFASEHPERVRRFAWLAQAGMNRDAPQNSGTFKLPTREALQQLYATEALGSAIYDQMMSRSNRQETYFTILDYINRPEIREEFSMRPRFPNMPMPILFGNGDSNTAIPVENAVEGFRLAPLGRLTVAMGGSAPGGYNSPELVGAAIRFFTAETIQPARPQAARAGA